MPITTFTISGNAGLAGATVTLSGASSASTTAAGDGTYSFGGLSNGTYIVTPSSVGKEFSPTNRTAMVSGASIANVNFTVFTPSQVGSNAASIVTAGPRFFVGVGTPRTKLIGTNLGTKMLP